MPTLVGEARSLAAEPAFEGSALVEETVDHALLMTVESAGGGHDRGLPGVNRLHAFGFCWVRPSSCNYRRAAGLRLVGVPGHDPLVEPNHNEELGFGTGLSSARRRESPSGAW